MSIRFSIVLITLLFFFDAANSVLIKEASEFYRLSVFYRAFLEILVLLFFIKCKYRKITENYIMIFFFTIIFIIGFLLNNLSIANTKFIEPIIILNKYFFILDTFTIVQHFCFSSEI